MTFYFLLQPTWPMLLREAIQLRSAGVRVSSWGSSTALNPSTVPMLTVARPLTSAQQYSRVQCSG